MNKDITKKFLETLFSDHLAKYKGYIEIRRISARGAKCSFYTRVQDIVDDPDNYEGNVFYGIAPRIERRGKKDSVKYITCLWVDADVKIKDKPNAPYDTKEQALGELNTFHLKPSIVVDSGNGLHYYWLLRESVEADLVRVESILDGLISELKADNCGDVSRVFRLPGTINLKDANEPKETRLLLFDKDIRYTLEDFKQEEELGDKLYSEVDLTQVVFDDTIPKIDFDVLRQSQIAPTILRTIKDGNFLERYPSRSERDQAVILELLLNRFTREQIKAIFNNPDFAISDRYLGLGRRGDTYLKRSIIKAEQAIKDKKLFIKKERRPKKVNLPKSTFRMVDKWMPYGEQLLPIDRGYAKIEDENFLIYRKTDKTKNGEEVREYVIHKDIVAQDAKIKLEYLREAYISSVFLVQSQKTPIIEFNLQDKINGVFYSDNRKISGTERQDRALAEKLLFYTTYRRRTKVKGKEIESLQHLYAGIEETRDASGHIRYRIELNQMYLKEMLLDTGLIDARGKGGYYQLLLPLRMPGTEKDRRIRYSLQKLNSLLRYKDSDTRYIRYNVTTHLKAIGVKEYELKRKGLCKEIWAYIEPTFKQVGHKITQVILPPGKDMEDVRNWTLIVERRMVSDRLPRRR